MSISGIGGPAAGAAQQKAGAAAAPEEAFLAYMKKTPVERWVESWLAARGLTKEEFDALPQDEHEALARKMAEDLKTAMHDKRV